MGPNPCAYHQIQIHTSEFWLVPRRTLGGQGVSWVSAAGVIQMNPWWGAGFLPWIWTFGPPRAMWLAFPQFLLVMDVWFASILFGEGRGEMKVFGRKSYGSFDHSLFNGSPYHDYGTNPEYQLHVFPRLFGSESFLTHLLQLQAPVQSQRPGGRRGSGHRSVWGFSRRWETVAFDIRSDVYVWGQRGCPWIFWTNAFEAKNGGPVLILWWIVKCFMCFSPSMLHFLFLLPSGK